MPVPSDQTGNLPIEKRLLHLLLLLPPNATKHWWRRVPAWKPQWNATPGRQLCCCCCILVLRFYGWAVMLMCLEVVGYRQRMLYCEGGPLWILGTTCSAHCSCHQPVVRCCFILLLKIYGWAVVILVRLLGMSTCMWQWEDWLWEVSNQ